MELIEIARLEEGRKARALVEVAPETRPFAGGMAGRGEPGQWINHALGVGLHGAVDAAELDDVMAWYVGKGIEPRFEVSAFVGEEFLRLLEERGFGVRFFRNVFYREVDARVVRPVQELPRDVELKVVDPEDEAEIRAYATMAISGFYTPTEAGHAVIRRSVKHPRTVAMVARAEGKVVAAGAMEVAGEVAGIFGASVQPEFRRRGIQQALLAARMNIAAERGARIACIGAKPGIATERNVRRMGFELGYVKLVMAKSGEGLVGVAG